MLSSSILAYSSTIWQHPCTSGQLVIRGIQEDIFHDAREPKPEENIARYHSQLIREMSMAVDTAMTLKDYILQERFFGSRRYERLCQTEPSLAGMPQVEITHTFDQGMFSTLSFDFRRLATISVFVHEMQEDTRGRRRSRHSYRGLINALSTHLQNSLCLMEVVALSHDIEIPRDVTEQIMPSMYKNLNRTLRDRRNCLVARDTTLVLNNVIDKYAEWEWE